MIKFGKIKQFRDVIHEVSSDTFYKNADRDEDGQIIRSKAVTQPTIKFYGTVKIHGTNASWVFDEETQSITCQSRNRELTPGNDNLGFATWTESVKEDVLKFFINSGFTTDRKRKVVVYGEWCGPGIQKGVGVSDLENKIFVIFRINVINEKNTDEYFADFEIKTYLNKIKNVYSSSQFETWDVDIDFNNPKLVQNKLIEITEKVEKECPVAKHFGISGIGEGVVWSAIHDNKLYCFKVKGEKHSVSKVKSLAPVDLEKIASINSFIDTVVTENRLNQGVEFLKETGKEVSIKSTGDFLSWFINDVRTEEALTITENDFNEKMLNREISKRARVWYFEYLDKLALGDK